MKKIKFLLLFMIIPILNYAQICSANPGGDQSICIDDPMILYGEDSDFYLHPLEIEWEVIQPNDGSVSITDPNSLVTSVVYNSGGNFPIGTYQFQLTVTCLDDEQTSSIVTITVGEIIVPAEILSPSDNKIETCESQIEFIGSTPDFGVTANWSITPDIDVNLTPTANGGVILNHYSTVYCDYTLTYYQSVGSCTSFDEVDISFTRSHPSVTIDYLDPAACPTCTKRIRVGGTQPGCNGTPVWTVSPSTGVDIETPNNRATWINFEETGNYDISYTIENGDCPTASITSSCQINDIPGFEIGQDERYVSCSDTWDFESLDLSVNDMAGVEYEWKVYSSMGSSWISIDDPTASSTSVNFSGVPVDVSANGLWIRFDITAYYNNCMDEKSIYFYYNPRVDIDEKDVYLLCGGDPFFRLIEHYSTNNGGTHGLSQVLSAPLGANLPPGSFSPYSYLDLTVCGTYSFLVTVYRTGIDFENGVSVTCTDEEVLTVIVGNIPTINAGSDIETCLTTTELNGNTPTDPECGELDIPISWEVIDGPPITFVNDSEPNTIVTDLVPGTTYTLLYTFSTEPGCLIQDEMTLTVLPEEECEPCELEVERAGECTEGCIQYLVSGNADEYMWIPSDGVDLTNPEMPVICETEGGSYLIVALKSGVPCASTTIEVPPCTNMCEPIESEAILVYAGCAPDIGPNTVEYDIILPDFPQVPISEITVTGGGQLYYDALDRLHYNGSLIACGEICFTIYVDELCSASYCIDLPTCLGTPCNDIFYLPSGYCISEEGSFALGVEVYYYSGFGNPASEIYSYNEENLLEFDYNYFTPQNYPSPQASALEFWGSSVNENGVIPLVIQVLGPLGQVLCEDRKQFNPDYFCDDQDLIDWAFNVGGFPGGGHGGEGDDRYEKEEDAHLAKQFNIYPVPASNMIHIDNVTSDYMKVDVIDVSGKIVASYDSQNTRQLSIPVNQLPQGIYMFSISDIEGQVVGREIVPIVR